MALPNLQMQGSGSTHVMYMVNIELCLDVHTGDGGISAVSLPERIAIRL